MRRALPGLAVWEALVLLALPYGPGTAGLAAGGLAGAVIYWVSGKCHWHRKTHYEQIRQQDHGQPY